MLDPLSIRSHFPIFSERRQDPPLIYLDNAASTQKPVEVIEAVSGVYRTCYSNVHRSPHRIGLEATDLFEGTRAKLAKFMGVNPTEIVFTRGTTEAINLVALFLQRHLLQKGDVILTSPSEHHSNLIPWQLAAERTGAELKFIELHGNGEFDPDEIAQNWDPRTKVFAFQHASNVTGAIHPVRQICYIARKNGALTVVDGAQAAPHIPLDLPAMGCDFYALSSHKMCGPSGIGALWGRKELLESYQPVFGGGEMIKRVSREGAEWNDVPARFEAGTPNIEGVIGWGAAIDFLTGIGVAEIERYVGELAEFAYDTLSRIDGVTVFGPPRGRTGAVSFWVDGVHPHDLASILDSYGIAVRAGHHCAEPLMHWLGVPATTRASFYLYNTREEVEALVEGIEGAKKVMGNVA